MKGLLSFHPVDLGFFDDVVSPLVAGRKINPGPFVEAALKLRRAVWATARWKRALETCRASATPPAADPSATVWQRVRHTLEAFDFRPDKTAVRALNVLDPELHLEGRPFLITEGSAEGVAAAVEVYRVLEREEDVDRIAREQLRKLDPDLAEGIEPQEGEPLSGDYQARADLLAELKKLHDMAFVAREGTRALEGSSAGGASLDVLIEELPWRALGLHAEAVPYWVARDVDGLETTCQAAGVMPPTQLVPAWRLFAEACEQYPPLKETLTPEIRGARGLGGFVPPSDVSGLLDFLEQHGVRIIAAAARQGEGATCATLLRKIKECAVYARRRGFGYLEAAGLER